jgi:hypothetical protein
MTIIVSFVTKTDLIQTVIMMAEHNYTGKRNTARSIIYMSSLKPKQKEKLIWFLGEIHKHNALRNHIAHSTWVVGTRPGSIKPFGISIRDRKPRFVGMGEGEPDWMVSDLEAAADELNRTYDDLKDYMDSIGLVPDMPE